MTVSGRRREAGQKLAAELQGLGADAEFFPADVRREEDVRNLVDKVVARFGRLDLAVNDAGTEGILGPVTDPRKRPIAAPLTPMSLAPC